ncbi:MAG: DNA polymerase III subunit gamma/tau [Pirellulales bacterium]
MSDPAPSASGPASPSADHGEYVVVARRYRPQRFTELVGQEHVARALSGAIAADRVGHAYLFTGARGVGKTSSARILAKALNCQRGMSAEPCGECDICRQIAAGSDVDVLEIDGASNRGIDEIRQLRQNVNVRPSRARFKIYIIDEVHMLTREAFNALLKTLEEPPEHVKFIFCTTEATKIPITILSRCQRFDFAGIETGSIAERLAQIVEAEGLTAEPEALEIIARRAAGSMRDSQSLLEQLLAVSEKQITAADVHRLLGSADEARVGVLVSALLAGDAAAALAEVDAALHAGVDPGQLLEQTLGAYRDLMVSAAGAPPTALNSVSSSRRDEFASLGRLQSLPNVLAALQVLEQASSRLRYSTHGRVIVEMAIVRLCQLPDLEELSEAANRLRDAVVSSDDAPKKKAPVELSRPVPAAVSPAPAMPAANGLASRAPTSPAAAPPTAEPAVSPAAAVSAPTPPAPDAPLSADQAPHLWRQALAGIDGLLGDHAGLAAGVAISGPNLLVVQFEAKYNFSKEFCERPAESEKLRTALREAAGQTVNLRFDVVAAPAVDAPSGPARRSSSKRERLAERSQHPLVKRLGEVFEARPVALDEPDTK